MEGKAGTGIRENTNKHCRAYLLLTLFLGLLRLLRHPAVGISGGGRLDVGDLLRHGDLGLQLNQAVVRCVRPRGIDNGQGQSDIVGQVCWKTRLTTIWNAQTQGQCTRWGHHGEK